MENETEKNKGGRPQIALTEEQVNQIEALAAYLNMEQIEQALDKNWLAYAQKGWEVRFRIRQYHLFLHHLNRPINQQRTNSKLSKSQFDSNGTDKCVMLLLTVADTARLISVCDKRNLFAAEKKTQHMYIPH